MDQKPEEKTPAPPSPSAFKFLMRAPTALVNEVDQAATKTGQTRVAWWRLAATEKLGRSERAPEGQPPATTASDFPFMMYMPQWLGDEVTLVAKEQGLSREEWLRHAAVEKLERHRKEGQ
jgi:hypothetical protein